MTFTPSLRRFALLAHVTASVGWLGAVLVFLGLALIGLTSNNEATARGAYLVMAPAAWFVLVPLAHASLLSGIVLSLGTAWGLFRHYWVVVKLAITAFATVILLIYMRTFREMGGVAADSGADLALVRNLSPTVHAILALLLLLIATGLAIYKPFGMTAYGLRQQAAGRRVSMPTSSRPNPTPGSDTANTGTSRWVYVAALGIIAAIALFVVLHLLSGRLSHD